MPNWTPLEHLSMFCEEIKKKEPPLLDQMLFNLGEPKGGEGGGMGPTSLQL